jgi:hypothetical protein
MNIDRHNYEEFFLLYIDNELNIAERRQVDLFVKENPDLEEELLMLKQSKLIPDESIIFTAKDSLMKQEDSAVINLNNYEEWFVLYLDDELTPPQKKSVEQFIAANPAFEKEFSLFTQTKLDPVLISLPGKESLYRKEEKTPVIAMKWWRIAVAAVLVIAAGIGTYTIITNNRIKPGSETAKNNSSVKKNINTPASIKDQSQQKDPLNQNVDQKSLERNIAEAGNKEPKTIVQKKKQIKTANNNDLVKRNSIKQKEQAEKKPGNNLPVPLNDQHSLAENNVNKLQVEKKVITSSIETQSPDALAFNEKPKPKGFNIGDVTKKNIDPPIVTDKVEPIYASNTENKSLRGFFRKATRIIERTTKVNPANDDNKVLIGGVAINLK